MNIPSAVGRILSCAMHLFMICPMLAQVQSMPNNVIRLDRVQSVPLVQWCYGEFGVGSMKPCLVPSTIQDLLIADGHLADPHYRTNEAIVQWPSLRDWIYETTLNIASLDDRDTSLRHFIEFDGVDTYSDIYLNGHRLGETDNMFVGYRFDVTDLLRAGINTLKVHLKSPLRIAHSAYLASGINYPADNDHAPIKYSVFTRKAPYHYGWDWGMRLVAMGIWQPIRLSTYRHARIDDVHLKTSIEWTKDGGASSARIHIGVDTERYTQEPVIHRSKLYDESGKLVAQGMSLLEIKRPNLWWPAQWGKPYLYRLVTELYDSQGQVIDTDEKHIGIRELVFVNQPDKHGTSFFWIVNKYPLYIKGTNYIPGDLILTRRSDEDFRRLFEDMRFAHINMVRVWGGGVYEDERFYAEADRQGILVWQDFMFACTAYPTDRIFLDRVKREAVYQVKRLAHHPSLALWCGNNEVEEAIKYWGWQRRYSQEHYRILAESYDPLFRELLPQIVHEYAPSLSYIHGSPMSANWGRSASWGHGDAHYWGVWYGEKPFDVLDESPLRFVSEFGFQSFPEVKSLLTFAREDDLSLESDVMRTHQKASTGNKLIRKYMEREYHVPASFKQFVYVGQVLQARGMEHMVRSLRRHRPIGMGAMYWQLNDAWPAVSWSSIDYYQNYKGLHYRLREAFAPLAILPRHQGDTLELYVANDHLRAFEHATLSLTAMTFSGELLRSEKIKVAPILGNSVSLLTTIERKQWQIDTSRRDVVLNIELKTEKEMSTRLMWYGLTPKEMPLPKAQYALSVLSIADGYADLELRAHTLLRDVCLSLSWHRARWERNYFDLLPNECVRLRVHHSKISPTNLPTISIEILNDIYNEDSYSHWSSAQHCAELR